MRWGLRWVLWLLLPLRLLLRLRLVLLLSLLQPLPLLSLLRQHQAMQWML